MLIGLRGCYGMSSEEEEERYRNGGERRKGRGFYDCLKKGSKMTEYEAYDMVCENWEFWNPNAELNDKGESVIQGLLFKKECRNCKHKVWCSR